MRLKILIFVLFVVVIIITPFEAKLLNQSIQWMYMLNLSELTAFIAGIVTYKYFRLSNVYEAKNEV